MSENAKTFIALLIAFVLHAVLFVAGLRCISLCLGLGFDRKYALYAWFCYVIYLAIFKSKGNKKS